MRRSLSDEPLRWALLRHVGGTLAILLVVVAIAIVVAERLADREALAHAEVDARTLAAAYVLPLSDEDLQTDDSATNEALHDAFADRLSDGSLLRIKIWAPAGDGRGTIVFSDSPTLQGTTSDLGEAYRLFGTTGAMSNAVQPGDYPTPYPDGTYEVYLGFTDGQGNPFIFEAYLPTPDMATSARQMLGTWLPLTISALLLLTLATLPLAIRLARRVARVERERRDLVIRALDASADERQRLAMVLHDGVVQDLSGVSLTLDSLTTRTPDPESGGTIARAAERVRSDVAALRTLADDLAPVMVAPETLADAVQELVRSVDSQDLSVSVQIEPDHGLDEDGVLLAYRAVREGLRNITKHASATTASIMVRRCGRDVAVQVSDDGVGPGARRRGRKHLGLRLLSHAARDADGALELTGDADSGTTLTLRLPLPT